MNKTIIITGASRGIGKEIVIQLSKNKSHKIYALSRDINKMAQALRFLDEETGAIVPPIQSAATYSRDANYEITNFKHKKIK